MQCGAGCVYDSGSYLASLRELLSTGLAGSSPANVLAGEGVAPFGSLRCGVYRSLDGPPLGDSPWLSVGAWVHEFPPQGPAIQQPVVHLAQVAGIRQHTGWDKCVCLSHVPSSSGA